MCALVVLNRHCLCWFDITESFTQSEDWYQKPRLRKSDRRRKSGALVLNDCSWPVEDAVASVGVASSGEIKLI